MGLRSEPTNINCLQWECAKSWGLLCDISSKQVNEDIQNIVELHGAIANIQGINERGKELLLYEFQVPSFVWRLGKQCW